MFLVQWQPSRGRSSMPSKVKQVNVQNVIVADFDGPGENMPPELPEFPNILWEEEIAQKSSVKKPEDPEHIDQQMPVRCNTVAWEDADELRKLSTRGSARSVGGKQFETTRLTQLKREKMANSPARIFGFTDPEDIKRRIQEAIASDKSQNYTVFDFYWPNGCFQYIAKHPAFENVTLAVIAANAVYMAVATDWNKDRPLEAVAVRDLKDSPLFWRVMENCFCAYFTIEWIIRFGAFRNKLNCFRDSWFMFDSLLVVMMVLETWIMEAVTEFTGFSLQALGDTAILRLFRLLRLSRLLRMLKSHPELMILIRGMVAAVSSVLYVLFLLLALTYAFAIALTQLAVETDVGDMYFANVTLSMYHLFIHATFMDDLAQFTNDMRHQDTWHLLALTLIFVCLAALTLMNMLVGVLCEVVSAVAVSEREEIRGRHAAVRMQKILESLDENLDKQISYQEFSKMIEKPEALRCLKDVGVNPLHVIELSELFFFEGDIAIELTFAEFMEAVLDLRESNQANVKDLINLWGQVKSCQTTLKRDLEKKISKLDVKVDDAVSRLSASIDDKHEKLQKTIEEQCELMRGCMTTALAEVQQGNRFAGKPVHAVEGTVRRAGTTSRVQSKGQWDKPKAWIAHPGHE